jgi:serralysin
VVNGNGGPGGGGSTINGTAGNDTLVGTSDNDTINGLGGDDLISGEDGADSLNGGDGNDTMDAGLGFGFGDGAADTLSGGLGNDEYLVHENEDVILADPGGIDTVRPHNISWTLGAGLENLFVRDTVGTAVTGTGNELDNHMTSSSEGGTLFGMGGNDLLQLRNVQNFSDAHGGDGNDTIQAGRASDLFGDAGNDVLIASNIAANMTGGAGNDSFVFTDAGSGAEINDFVSGVDKIRLDANTMTRLGASGNFSAGDARFHAAAGASGGHDADDRVVYNTSTNELFYDADGSGGSEAVVIAMLQPGATLVATDIAVDNGSGGSNTITGTEGDDLAYGTQANDTVNLLGGDDGFHVFGAFGAGASYGDDTVNGGSGFDKVYFFDDNNQSGIVADLSAGIVTGGGPGGSGSIQLISVEGAEGTTLADRLTGDAGANWFDAGIGVDTLNGGAGNDTLMGGNDLSLDSFVFTHFGAANADSVDLNSGEDKIVLDGSVFTSIGASGNFASNDARFFAGAGATSGQDASDRVIFDTSTGDLWYDADGNGSGAAQLFASLFQSTSLTATDIQVINGSPGGSTINGTAGDDSMFGTPGDDTVNGLGGNDDLMGQAGNDRLDGGTGNDFLLGESGADHLIGGEGNDSLAGEDDLPYGINDFADTLDGGLGNDHYYIHGDEVVLDAGGIDSASINVDWTLAPGIESAELTGEGLLIHGNELANRFLNFPYWTDDQSLPAPSTIFAGAGNDTMAGGWPGASEIFHGEAGDDLMSASGYARFTGGVGADTFVAWFAGPLQDPEHAPFDVNLEIMDFASGVDQMRLNAGGNMSGLGASGEFAPDDARFHASAGATGGHDADDRVVYDTSSGNLWYDADGSGSASAELIARLAGAPTVVATDIEVINGTAPVGGQTINGTANNDALVGGAGNDTINGLAGADLLQGLGGNDSILGGTGWDTLQGGDGGDWLQSGGWSDTMTGGAGADSFVWAEAGSNHRDTVTDFVSGTDELLFENGTLNAMGASGAWAAGDTRFWAAAGATAGHDADDRLVYNTSTGNLYYDADGSGAGAAQVVATFTGAPGVVATDITVI